MQKKGIDLPFIIVSGAIGEETAVAAMKAGAHDYLIKARLARLAPAVERELREAEERRKRRQAEQALRDTEAEILRISEREQSRIGRDLHDGVCQILVGTSFMADKLGKDLAAGKLAPAAAVASVGEIKNLVVQAIEDAHALAKGLYVVRLEEGSLRSALEDLAATSARVFGISCVVKGDGLLDADDNHKCSHIYRIVQEAVSTAVKHGKAQSVEIEIASRDNDEAVTVTIKDDGIGLPPTRKKEGMGLKTMAYRARVLGGSLEVRRGPRGGTEVVFLLPMLHEDRCSQSQGRKSQSQCPNGNSSIRELPSKG